MNPRSLSFVDQLFGAADEALRIVFGPAPRPSRPSPAAAAVGAPLTTEARVHAGRLMRVNHSGEICAQALYQGQALTARRLNVKTTLGQAALEENDHLAWCDDRIRDLGARRSYLNPLWYVGSFSLGAAIGLAGDRWSLGFLAETERQVVAHLERHLARLPTGDEPSRTILNQMRVDEAHHATVAIESGGANLPTSVKRLMYFASQIMTRSAYWI